MDSAKRISNAVNLVSARNEILRKVLEDLQSHSSSLASFTLQWKDLEDHCDSIKKLIEEQFKQLESKEKESCGGLITVQSQPEKEEPSSVKLPAVTPRPELKYLCVNMDGKGLRSYILDHRKELPVIRDQVAVALQFASDSSKLVLDAIKGFFPSNSKRDKEPELSAIRRTCILLLEQLLRISPQINPQVKEKARRLAVEWKGKIRTGDENLSEPLGFLQLLATYGLVSDFDRDEVLELIAAVSRRKQAIDFCRDLGFTDKMPDLIQNLITKGKHFEAIRFVFAFELVDKFPPVPLLKAFVKDSKKVALEICKKGNNSLQSQNNATAKEIAALKTAIRYIEDHKLESQYSRENLEKCVEQLEKQKAERKRAAETAGSKPQQQQSENKRPRLSAPAAAVKTVAGAISMLPPLQQAHLKPAGLLTDQNVPYLGLSAGHYGLSGTIPVAPYISSSTTAPYGLPGTRAGFSGDLSPTRPHLYSSESPIRYGLYDRPAAYGGYGLPPQYRQSFYP